MQQKSARNQFLILRTDCKTNGLLDVKQSRYSARVIQMSIPRFSVMMSARKYQQKHTQDEIEKAEKNIQAETFGEITNDTVIYTSASSKEKPLTAKVIHGGSFGQINTETVFYTCGTLQKDASSGKFIQAETFGQITNETDKYNAESPKYVFGAGNMSDFLRVWPEGNFQGAINSQDKK